MPIQGFICNNCSEEFELIRKMSDFSVPSCPNCNSSEYVSKTVGKTSFKLKGSCWANDNYSNKE